MESVKRGANPYPENLPDSPKIKRKQRGFLPDYKEDQVGRLSPEWEAVQQKGEHPPPVTQHAVAVVGSKVFHFGGTMDTKEGGGLSSTLYCFDSVSSTWTKINPASDDNPTCRIGCGMTECAGDLYLFGGYGLPAEAGYDGPYQRLNDLWCYHVEEGRWERVAAKGDAPSARTGHSLVSYEDRLVVFGGYGLDTKGNHKLHTLSDTHVFDLVRMEWTFPEVSGQKGRYQLIPRHSHSATVVDNKMVVFGGYCDQRDSAGRTHDVNILNLETYDWSAPTTIGKGVAGRTAHSAVHYEGKMFFFGGMISVEKSDESEAAEIRAKEEAERKGKVLWNKANKGYKYKLAADKKGAFRSVVEGALAENNFLMNEVDVLDLTTMHWYYFEVNGTMVGRMGHTACLLGSSMYVMGGTDGTGARSDMLRLPLQ